MSRFSTRSVAITIAVVAFSAPAYAGNEAAAEALFGEAKKLAGQGKYAEACPKFAESNRLDRGAGTLIHLGDCYEKNKQVASAWATYKEASSAAQALGRKDWEKLATQRATALEPKLAHLTIKVPTAVDKLEVSRDGENVARAAWGSPIPVDAGPHRVEATAPGYKAFKATSTVSRDGENVEVAIPTLERDSSAPAPAPAPIVTTTAPHPAPVDADTKSGGGQRTLGFVVAGVGVAGIAVGAVTGLMAIGKTNDAKATCPTDGACSNQSAVDASDSANTLGLVSTIGFAAGAAALVAGVVLVVTAPSAKKTAMPTLRFTPTAGRASAGFGLSGSF